MANKTVGIGVGPVHSRKKVNHQHQFVPQAVLLRTSKVNILPASPQPVPTGKPKVFAPVLTGRQNRPFLVPTDRGYSPLVSSGWWKNGQLLLSPQQVVLRNHIETVYTGYPRAIVDLIHLHTDDNVADLLTKAFDGPRVFNSPMLHLLRVEMVINSPWIMPILGTKELASPEQTAPGSKRSIQSGIQQRSSSLSSSSPDGGKGKLRYVKKSIRKAKVVNKKRNNKGCTMGKNLLKSVSVSKGFQVGKDFAFQPKATSSNGNTSTRGETNPKAGPFKNIKDDALLITKDTNTRQQDTSKKKISNIASSNLFAALGVDDDKEEEVCSRWKWTSNRSLCSKGSRIILGRNDDLVGVMIMAQTNQVMHVKVNTCADHKTMFCSFVYADNYYIDRHVLWSNLVGHAKLIRNRSWVLLGDFNAALNLEDHLASGYESNAAMREFKECVQPMEINRIMGNLCLMMISSGDFNAALNLEDHLASGYESNAAMREFKECVQPMEARNRIEMVSDASNNLYDGNQVPSAFVNHYNQFLRAEGVTIPLDDHDLFTCVLDDAKADLWFVMSLMMRKHGKKAWDVVGGDITCVVQDFFSNDKLLKDLNHTIISLIPKVTTPARINDYRLISCCNVLYKCISKIIANRVKEGLGDIVSIIQYVFVHGRRISDNILLTQELMRNYHRRSGLSRAPTLYVLMVTCMVGLKVPLLLDDIDDIILWRDRDGVLRPFSVACSWDTIHSRADIVNWYNVVWFPHCISRHAIHMWLVFLQKLMTQDRLRQWDVGPSIDLNLLRCPLCNLVPDSHDHLFFECVFSSLVGSKGKMAVSILSRLVLAVISYYIWLERNGRLFKKKTSSSDKIVDVIISMVRLKLVTFKSKKMSTWSRLLLDQWKIPSYCIVHDGSSNDIDMTEVKVLKALADDENVVVGIESAKNAESQVKMTDPSVSITNSSAIEYDSADESLVCSNPLPQQKKLAGVEPSDIKKPIWYLDSGCSRHMTGVKSYLHKYVKQPGPKVGLEMTQHASLNDMFDEKRGTIFNSSKEIVMIASRVRDVCVLDMKSSTQ
nr:reverse transcriptase domain, reverse transcriptase zinc-binding domain protein [Tanacetum cinerariifolium]